MNIHAKGVSVRAFKVEAKATELTLGLPPRGMLGLALLGLVVALVVWLCRS